jgi:hypothetical protein
LAVAATLLIRFATLWFGVLIGAVALATMERRGASSGVALREPEPATPMPPE